MISRNLDVTGVMEKFLDWGVHEAEISVHGYKCYREDRDKVKGGHGPEQKALYVKNDVASN